VVLHIGVAAGLMYYEYRFPESIRYEYHNSSELFIDIMASFIIGIGYIFSITSYLRMSFDNERVLAEQRAQAIYVQNARITEQNQQLEKVNDERNKLFSIVSHDLKAPLDTIRGYLTLLSEDLIEGDEKRHIEKELLEQTNYTSDLLFNLLSWAKTQMHGVNIHLVPLNLNDLVSESVNNKMMFALKKGIRLSYSVSPEITVMCDRDMLHIVIRNLLNNALKFTDTGGEVMLKAVSDGKIVIISVLDSGIGIAPDKHKDLFTLKTHVSYGTNNEKGTGLGLMMCREFMEFQHGKIWFESTTGKGSTFFVSLPLAASVHNSDLKVKGQNVLSEN
jgi:signal transduction histidine kinase